MLRVQFLIDAQPSCSNGAVRFIVRLDIDLCSVARIGFEEFTSYALCTYRMFDAHAVAVEFSLVCRKFIEDERSSRSTPEEMSTRWAELRNSLHVTFDAGYIYIYIYIYASARDVGRRVARRADQTYVHSVRVAAEAAGTHQTSIPALDCKHATSLPPCTTRQ